MTGKMLVLFVIAAGATAGAFALWFRSHHPGTRQATVSIRRPVPSAAPVDDAALDAILARAINTGPMSRPRDFFRTIEQPKFLAAGDTGDTMSDDEIVLGLEIGGVARAYPINYLNDHEMVREEIGGLPLLITW
jgi:hypothetical protein